MNIYERAKAPTPRFFKLLRTIGLISAGVGGVLLGSPVLLPIVLKNLGGYLVLAGGVLSAVSQVTVEDDQVKQKH